jgi:hypothetical protein
MYSDILSSNFSKIHYIKGREIDILSTLSQGEEERLGHRSINSVEKNAILSEICLDKYTLNITHETRGHSSFLT